MYLNKCVKQPAHVVEHFCLLCNNEIIYHSTLVETTLERHDVICPKMVVNIFYLIFMSRLQSM